MKSSNTEIAISETIARMPIIANLLVRGEINRGARDNRLYLSAISEMTLIDLFFL